MENTSKQIWIGLIQVQPLPSSHILKTSRGAFVNVLTWASNADEYCLKAHELMDHLQLLIIGVESPEPLTHRGEIEDLDEGLAEIVTRVQQNPEAIMYGDFHTWSDPPS